MQLYVGQLYRTNHWGLECLRFAVHGRKGERGAACQGAARARAPRQCCPESQRACTVFPSLPPSLHSLATMSWPSAYGYKYTPIGLRQREKKDDTSGTRSISTTIHLPQGGHLLDIERQYGMDGSMSKRVSPAHIPHPIQWLPGSGGAHLYKQEEHSYFSYPAIC